MSFTEAIKICFRKYVNFGGRASRSEYWWFFLFAVIARLVTVFIPGVGIAVSLGLLLPSLSVTARRLHDTIRTGWWLLLPVGLWLAGIITGLIWLLTPARALAPIEVWMLGILAGAALGGINGTGLWGFLGAIAAFLAALYFVLQPGTPGPNRYGPDRLQMPPGMPGHDYTNPGQPHVPPPPNATQPENNQSGVIYAMSFTESIKICFQKYIDFRGRAGRPEFWWFILFTVVVWIATGWIPFIDNIVRLLFLLPLLAVGARRLHDIGRTGWWLLLSLVPIIGPIALLIMLALPGTPGPNRYGPDSRQPAPETSAPEYPNPGQSDAPPPYNAAPPDPLPPPGRRQYCPQCGAARTPDAAMFCTACGRQF